MNLKLKDMLVQVVDEKKLVEFLAVELPKNQELYLHSFAVWNNHFEVTPDVCFSEIYCHHFNGEIQPVLEIECQIKKWNEERTSYSVGGVDFIKVMALKDYLALSVEKKLTDYIRYNYNPRIMSNQRLFVKECIEYLKAREDGE